MNIMLNTACNQRCPYCFARDVPIACQNGAGEEMHLENVKTLISLFKAWDIRCFRILGGEPTLHSRFREIIGLVQASGFPIRLFTNGIMDRETVDFLAGREGIDYTMNHNDPAFYAALPVDPTPRIRYFLERCGKNVQLGVNIYTCHFEGQFLLDRIKEYNLDKHIRIGFALPIPTLDAPAVNTYLPIEDYRQVIPGLMEFSRACDREGIGWTFDCGMPLCVFTNEEYGELIYNVRALHQTTCRPIIDIGPDLTAWYCFVMSGMSNDRKITDFQTSQDLFDYFEKKFAKFKTIGAMDKCFHCRYLKRGQCNGGCLGHVINKFKRAKPRNRSDDPA